MSEHFSSPFSLPKAARLFPLPNVVLFPHVMLPLHIFEPRYRQMVTDSLNDDRLVTMALLRPGWEGDYDGSPAIYPVVCVGRILAEQKTIEGKFNLLLRGVCRARIVEELCAPSKLYRTARLELLEESADREADPGQNVRKDLREKAFCWLKGLGLPLEEAAKLIENESALGPLTDLLAYALPLPVEDKQSLLAEPDVARRATSLLQYMESKAPIVPTSPKASFPPKFSAN